MKLHNFVQQLKEDSEVQKLRSVGKALTPVKAPVVAPTPVVAVQEAKKPIKVSKTDDLEQQKREYAIAQLEDSGHHDHRVMHTKIKFYD